MQISLIECTIRVKEMIDIQERKVDGDSSAPSNHFPYGYGIWLMAFAPPIQLEYIAEWPSTLQS